MFISMMVFVLARAESWQRSSNSLQLISFRNWVLMEPFQMMPRQNLLLPGLSYWKPFLWARACLFVSISRQLLWVWYDHVEALILLLRFVVIFKILLVKLFKEPDADKAILFLFIFFFWSQTTLSDVHAHIHTIVNHSHSPPPPPHLSPEHVRCHGLIWLLRKSAVIEQTPSEIWWQMGPDPSKLLSAQIEISFSLLLTEMK